MSRSTWARGLKLMKNQINLTHEQKLRRQLERRKAQGYRRIVNLTPQAITLLEVCMSDSMRENYPSIALAASKDILDRAGLNAKQQIELDVTVSTLADAIRAKRLARQGVVELIDESSDNG